MQRVGVRSRVHRDRLHPELVHGADDADRDLAAVRYEYTREHLERV